MHFSKVDGLMFGGWGSLWLRDTEEYFGIKILFPFEDFDGITELIHEGRFPVGKGVIGGVELSVFSFF